MKAKDYNGTIKLFPTLPKSYGSIIGGFDLLSDSELQEYGFYNLVTPEYSGSIQELGDISFDSENNQFVYAIVDITWEGTLEELKAQQIALAKSDAGSILNATDWIIVRDTELGNTTSQAILDSRAAVRTACEAHEVAINALADKAAVMSYLITY
tara:strand:- start:10 stop:474 length:465 start_codon:yes stop_codon:yes gene_type:complete